MPEGPHLHLVLEKEAKAEGQSPTKIFVKTPPGKALPKAVRNLVEALVTEFRADKSWFDKCLIDAGGVTRVWVVKKMAGVDRVVNAEVHALRDYSAPDVVSSMRKALKNLVSGESNG